MLVLWLIDKETSSIGTLQPALTTTNPRYNDLTIDLNPPKSCFSPLTISATTTNTYRLQAHIYKMESRKRKLPQAGLRRRVRARAEPEPDLDAHDEMSDRAPSEEEVQGNESESGSDSDSESSDGSVSHFKHLLSYSHT